MKKILFFCLIFIKFTAPLLSFEGISSENTQKEVFNKIKINEHNNNFKPVVVSSTTDNRFHDFQKEHTLHWWVSGYRGFHIKDSVTGEEAYVLGGDGNSEVMNAYVVDVDKKIIFIDVNQAGGDSYYILYDFKNKKEIGRVVVPPCFIFPFYGKLLIGEFTNGPKKLDWYITDIFFKKKESNKLTALLTERQISFYPQSTVRDFHSRCVSMNLNKCLLIGVIEETGAPKVFVMVKWDKEFNSVTLEPILEQRTGDSQYEDEIQISSDGEWLAWQAHDDKLSDKTKVLLYQINAKYYGGLSMPLYCGTFSEKFYGSFMIHPKEGICYKVYDSALEKTECIYPLKDFNELLGKSIKGNEENATKKKNKNLELTPSVQFFLSNDGKRFAYLDDDKRKMHVMSIKNFTNFAMSGDYYIFDKQVFALAVNADFSYIATADWYNEISIWKQSNKFKTVALLKRWNVNSRKITTLAFSPDGTLLTSGSTDGYLMLWDMHGKLLKKANVDASIGQICISPDSSLIAVKTYDKKIKIFLRNGTEAATLQLKEYEGDMLFSQSGNIFLCGMLEAKIDELQIQNRIIGIVQRDCHRAAFSPDEAYYAFWQKYTISLSTVEGVKIHSISEHPWLVTASNWNQTIAQWFSSTGLQSMFIGHRGKTLTIALSPNEEIIATGGEDSTVKLWNKNGIVIRTLTGHSGAVQAVSFSPDGKYLASSGDDGIVMLWNINGTLVHTYSGFLHEIHGIAFSFDGKELYAWSNHEVKIWNIDGKLLASLGDDYENIWGVFPDTGTIAVNPKGDSKNSIVDRSGKVLHTFEVNFWGHNIKTSPYGKYLFVGYHDRGSSLRIFDSSGKKVVDIDDDYYAAETVGFFPSGLFFLTNFQYKNLIRIYDLKAKVLKEIKNFDTIYAYAVSKDEKSFYCAVNGGIKLFNISDEKEGAAHKGLSVISNKNIEPVKNFNFQISDTDEYKSSDISWDGTSLVHVNNNIIIQDVKKWEVVKKFPSVGSLSLISNNNKYVISVEKDTAIAVHDITTGRLIRKFYGHKKEIVSLYLSIDNSLIISAGRDGFVIIWDMQSGKEKTRFSTKIYDYTSISLSKNNRYLSLVCDEYCTLQDLFNNKIIKKYESYNAAAVSVDGKYLACSPYSYSKDKDYRKIIIYDIQKKKEIKNINSDGWEVVSIAITADNISVIALLKKDYYYHKLISMNIASGKVQWSQYLHNEKVNMVKIPINAKFVCVTGESVKLYDIKTGKLLKKHKSYTDGIENHIFSMDGKYLLTGQHNGVIVVWDIIKRKIIKEIPKTGYPIHELHLSEDNKYIVTSGCDNSEREILDFQSGNIVKRFEKMYTIYTIFSKGDRFVLDGGSNTSPFTIYHWKSGNKLHLKDLSLDKSSKALAVSSDEKHLISMIDDKTLCLWDIKTGNIIRKIPNNIYIKKIILSKNCMKGYAAAENNILIFDFKLGIVETFYKGKMDDVRALSLSSDEKYLLTYHGKKIYLWDITSKKLLKVFTHKDKYVTGATFSSDKKFIIVLYDKGLILYWNLEYYGIKL